MKRSDICRFIVSVVLMEVIFGMTFFQVDQKSSVTTGMLVSTSMAALVHAENRVNRTGTPGGDYGECFIVPSNLGASLNYSFSEKQSLPVWGNVVVSKERNNSGFFFAAMVLLLFSRFYQRSRTSSEDDGQSQTDFPELFRLYCKGAAF